MIYSLRIFSKFCRMIVHNIDDKSSLSHFSGDSKHSVIMWCDSWIFAILADFLKKFFVGLGTILEKIVQPYCRDLLCDKLFEMT